MARKSNTKRTIEELLNDSVAILTSTMTHQGKYLALDDICWQWTQLDGKYEGCKHWSIKAIESLNKLNSKGELFKYSDFFRHEHVVPKKVFIEKLLKLKIINEKIIEDLLNNYLTSAVVTILEERTLDKSGYRQSMPKEFLEINNKDYNNKWLRYKCLNIEVKNVSWMNKQIIEKNIIDY